MLSWLLPFAIFLVPAVPPTDAYGILPGAVVDTVVDAFSGESPNERDAIAYASVNIDDGEVNVILYSSKPNGLMIAHAQFDPRSFYKDYVKQEVRLNKSQIFAIAIAYGALKADQTLPASWREQLSAGTYLTTYVERTNGTLVSFGFREPAYVIGRDIDGCPGRAFWIDKKGALQPVKATC